LSEQDYIDYVYSAPKGSTPWLLLFGLTPYHDPRPDHKYALIMLKRVLCAKKAYGDNLNVGLLDHIGAEMVKQSMDLDNRMMGEAASALVFVKDGKVYYTQQT